MTMRRTLNTLAICALAIAVVGCQGVDGPGNGNGGGPGDVEPTRLVALDYDFDRPLGIASAGDGIGRLFVVEQGGTVRVVVDGVVQSDEYLDLTARITAGGEGGLLAIAFHPRFEENGRLFVHFTEAADGAMHAVIAELTAETPDAMTVETSEMRVIMTIVGEAAPHYGGQLAFGPDGHLYIAVGDRSEPSNAQTLLNMFGTILRVGVDGDEPYEVPDDNPFIGDDSALDEIWAYGLRNPWRISFDSLRGDLWIADVGQGAVEEVNRQAAGDAGGHNYGWPIMEGDVCYPPPSECDDTGLTMPLFTYAHPPDPTDRRSITGGYVYRGATFTGLTGSYVFVDYVTGSVFVAEPDEDDNWTIRTLFDETDMRIATLGQGEDGELYLADYFGGVVYQFAE